MKDLTHVAYIAGTPILFIVSAKSDVKSLKDFVAKSESGRATACLRVLRSVERGADGGAVVCHEGRPQVRDHSLQRRGAKHHRRGRQSYRLCDPDRDVGLGSAARRHRDRARRFRRAAACPIIPMCRRSRNSVTTWWRPTGSRLQAGGSARTTRSQVNREVNIADGEAREPAAHARRRHAGPPAWMPPPSGNSSRTRTRAGSR